MKKVYKICFIFLAIIMSLFVIAPCSNAATVNVNYTKDLNAKKSKKYNIKAGEEFFVTINIAEDDNKEIMSVYGTLDYDKNVLELVQSEEKEQYAKCVLGSGWAVGSVSKSSDKFMCYATERSRADNALSVKFRAKKNAKATSTEIGVKDLTFYNEEKNTQSKEEINPKVKVKVTPKWLSIIKLVLFLMVCAAVVAYYYFKYYRGSNEASSKLESDSQDPISKLDNEDKEIKDPITSFENVDKNVQDPITNIENDNNVQESNLENNDIHEPENNSENENNK